MGCFLCDAIAKGPGEETFVLEVTPHAVVLLNRFPYIAGHVMVAPRAHVPDLEALSAEQMVDLHETLRRCIARVRRACSPQGINVGMNLGRAAGAGLEEHLHYHVVPRFIGDTNATNIFGEIRIIPEDLAATWRRYLPHFREGNP
jgi:ATP adenylyltransferase